MQGRMIALTAAVALVVGGWTGGWFYLRGEAATAMDRTLADLARRGVTATCPERSIAGWPFRLEITCEKPTVTFADGSSATAARFAAIAVVDDIHLVRFAAAAPVEAVAADGSRLDASFERLVASLRHDLAGHVERLSIAADGLDARLDAAGVPAGRLTAKTAEFHARPVAGAPENLDLAASLAGAEAQAGGGALMPSAADLAVVAVLRQAALLGGSPDRLRAWSAAGGEIGVSEAVLAVGDTRIEASGSARLDTDGRPLADVTASATGLDWLTGQVKAGRPVPAALATLASAMMLLGRKDGDARVVEVKAGVGGLSANGLPLPVKLPKAF